MVRDIIIGKPIIDPWYIFCKEKDEWNSIKDEIYYTKERFLPKIMVDIGLVKSISEVRRNQKQLIVSLDHLDYMEIKWGKNRLFILIGE